MAKKRFYGDAVVVGASALSVRMPGVSAQATVPIEGVPVTLNDIKFGTVGATSGGPFIPACDAARIASIIVPAGVHAIIDFQDGRQFVCYCADKPVKVKPSMLAPAHAWKANDSAETLFTYLICDATGMPLIGTGATVLNEYNRLAAGIQVNLAVRTY